VKPKAIEKRFRRIRNKIRKIKENSK